MYTVEGLSTPYHSHSNPLLILLSQAARDGRENIVQQWMNLLPADSIDDQDSEGFSALHYATRFNKFKIIQLLIASGAGIGGTHTTIPSSSTALYTYK